MKVKDIMQNKLTFVTPDATVEKAVEVMNREKVGSLLVKQHDEPTSIITQGDIISALSKDENLETIFVKEIQHAPLLMIDEEENVLDASDVLAKYHVRRLVVTRNGKVVGIISSKVIGTHMRAIIEEYK